MNQPRSRAPRALLLLPSAAGGTWAVACAVAGGLSGAGFQVRLELADGRGLEGQRDADLLVIGAPAHGMSLTPPSARNHTSRPGPADDAQEIHDWVLGRWQQDGAGQPVATFETRLSRDPAGKHGASVRAAQILSWRRFTLLDRPRSFMIEAWEGPLLPEEDERARQWGAHLALRFRRAPHHDEGPGPEEQLARKAQRDVPLQRGALPSHG